MKKKLLSLCIAALAVCPMLLSCSGPVTTPGGDGDDGEPSEEKHPVVKTLSLDDVHDAQSLAQFIAEVDNPDGSHNNDAHSVGVIVSPYFTLKCGTLGVPVYAVRTSDGAHSFACLDVNADAFPLKLSLELEHARSSVTVLPESRRTEAALEGGTSVSARIDGYGSYSFVFDASIEMPLTVMVREYEEFAAPEGYTVTEVEPGTHDRSLDFTAEKQVLYFKPGVHYVHKFEMLDDTVLYLERGAQLRAVMPDAAGETPVAASDWAGMPRWSSMITATGKNNVRILGRGFIDFSPLDWHARSPITIMRCTNVVIDGVTLNNAPEWNLTVTQTKGVEIKNVVIWGYRQNSDGICINNSGDAVVEACFARSGDDLFEIKTQYANSPVAAENITFRDCAGWPDKARGFGIIHESNQSIKHVLYEGCSIGFASATWMDALGCLVVLVANTAEVDDVTFRDIEIYHNDFYPINVSLHEKTSSGHIKNVYFENVRFSGDKSIRVANHSAQGGTIDSIWFDDVYRNGKRITRKLGSDGLKLSLTNADSVGIELNKR